MSDKILFRSIGNRERLVDKVANEVQRLISESQLEPGMKLPSEKELSEIIGVSRTVIREAVKILVAKGLLETHQGSGTVVRELTGEQLSEHLNMLLQTNGYSLDDLHQVRSILEVEIAGLAAEKGSEAEIAEMSQLLDQMEAATGDPVVYSELDADFHNLLARMSGNTLLVMLMESVSGILRSVRMSVARRPGILLSTLPDHRRILENVRAHNMDEARKAMRNHLINARHIQDAAKGT